MTRDVLSRATISKQLCLFCIILSFSIALGSCSNVDTNWHRYNGRRCDIIGTHGQSVDVPSDGWRIIAISDNKQKEEYDWGWELKISTEKIPKEIFFSQGEEWEPLLTIKEIQYILLDEDGFELVRSTLLDQYMSFGSTETFRQTATISKGKALRASKSLYKIRL